MRTRFALLLAALLLAPAALAAQRPVDAPGPPPLAERAAPGLGPRRQQLQRQLLLRFMDRVSQRLALEPPQRRELTRILLQGEARRRELAREARDVRQQLARTSQDPATPAGEYDRLLDRMAELRRRDLELWRAEQADLGQVLTPRQRAQFMAMRLEFFERVQRIREQRLQPPPPPGQ